RPRRNGAPGSRRRRRKRRPGRRRPIYVRSSRLSPVSAPPTASSPRRRAGFAPQHVSRSGPVVLAEIRRQILAPDPAQLPAALPRPRISARIVDRDLVPQRVEIRPREALDQAEPVRVRQAAAREPEVL